jgi:hypothetical protein
VRRRFAVALCALAAATIGSACGSAGATPPAGKADSGGAGVASRQARGARSVHQLPYPQLLGAATGTSPTSFVPAMLWHGRVAAWIARSASAALLSFDQRQVALRLHSGTIDAGAAGWRWGPEIAGAERRRVVAAFNGAFKLSTHSGGFESYGRVAAPLRPGLGSIVTYSDGSTDIGAWQAGVPAAGRSVVSVRQNLQLLIDNGRAAASVGCLSCWGATLGGVTNPARSALGITADGRLIWAGGEHLTVSALTEALLAARVVRAVELDINPEWVAAYLYGHGNGRGRPAPVPVATGQPGVPGQFLAPDGRDFYAVVPR